MDGSTSAAVISGGLDCKIIRWDTSTRSMLSARHTGDTLAQADQSVHRNQVVLGKLIHCSGA